MHKTDLTEYDVRPPKMINYLRYNDARQKWT